jgi:hypothetical protein
MRLLPLVFLTTLLLACSVNNATKDGIEIKKSPITPTKIIIQVTATSTPETKVEPPELAAFVDAWNRKDVSEIRSLYTEDARYFSESEVQNLEFGKPIDVNVKDQEFAKNVEAYNNYQLRILGKPIVIFDKLIAFPYRWEKEGQGINGVALLRYENDKILIHTFLTSEKLTSNKSNDTQYFEDINLDDLMRTWNTADIKTAQKLYNEGASILSDEDLMQAPWRDFTDPPRLEQVISQFKGWDPVVDGTPKRIDDLIIYTWHWNIANDPIGHGVRIMRYKDATINTDIRYAIRPWETEGKPFMVP